MWSHCGANSKHSTQKRLMAENSHACFPSQEDSSPKMPNSRLSHCLFALLSHLIDQLGQAIEILSEAFLGVQVAPMVENADGACVAALGDDFQ